MAFLKEKRILPHQAIQNEYERELKRIDADYQNRERAFKLAEEENKLKQAKALTEVQGKKIAEPSVVSEVELQKFRKGVIA